MARSSGDVYCTYSPYGSLNRTGPFSSFSAGQFFVCGIWQANDSLSCWGTGAGPTDLIIVPAEITDSEQVLELQASRSQICARYKVTLEGTPVVTVLCWAVATNEVLSKFRFLGYQQSYRPKIHVSSSTGEDVQDWSARLLLTQL